MHIGYHARIGAAAKIPVVAAKPIISYSPVVLKVADRAVDLQLPYVSQSPQLEVTSRSFFFLTITAIAITSRH